MFLKIILSACNFKRTLNLSDTHTMKHIGILPTLVTLALCLLVLAEAKTGKLNVSAAPTMTGAIQFSSPFYSSLENVGSITILLSRTGDTSTLASIHYATTDTDNFTIGCSDTSGSAAFARCDSA